MTPSAAASFPSRFGLHLKLAHEHAAQSFNAALRPLGIEGRHYGVLLQLGAAGPLSQRQLIDRVLSDKSSMVRIVDDLEARGLAVRRPAVGDRRAHAVELTDEGRTLLAAAKRTAAEVSGNLLDGFTPEELEQFLGFLERFVAPRMKG